MSDLITLNVMTVMLYHHANPKLTDNKTFYFFLNFMTYSRIVILYLQRSKQQFLFKFMFQLQKENCLIFALNFAYKKDMIFYMHINTVSTFAHFKDIYIQSRIKLSSSGKLNRLIAKHYMNFKLFSMLVILSWNT